jgi:hypothetical protein
MKQKLAEVGRRVLLIFLISSLLIIFASSGVMATDGANPVRFLPATVSPGQTFDVTVTFTSPDDDFNAIGLDDFAPAGWTVSVNTAWCSPTANESNANANEAVYIWYGPYVSGVGFTAVYKVTVPGNAELGIYDFSGTLEYYIGEGNDSAVIPISGDYPGAYQIEVVAPSPAVGGEAYPVNKLAILAPWIALAVVIAGAVIFFVRRRPAQS